MKTRSVTLIKIIKTGYIVISLTFCAIGIMFIADPDVSARNLITLLGICMIVFGAVKIVGYFSRDLFRLAFQYDLELGVILAITGIAVLTWPAGSVTVIFTALGIDALADALFKLRIAIDAKRFGIIPGVTDRDYYTNSFHIPVYYPISAFEKIKLEAPYHALTNGGHISYVELDGDPLQNLDAFESVIRMMKESGIGYGSINHPVDRDPCCGYTGIIGDTCPQCGRSESDESSGFERIRRITGYLVGSVERFNNGKRAEVKDRVKHDVNIENAEQI